jgi:hypothetical protein
VATCNTTACGSTVSLIQICAQCVSDSNNILNFADIKTACLLCHILDQLQNNPRKYLLCKGSVTSITSVISIKYQHQTNTLYTRTVRIVTKSGFLIYLKLLSCFIFFHVSQSTDFCSLAQDLCYIKFFIHRLQAIHTHCTVSYQDLRLYILYKFLSQGSNYFGVILM